ncbi:MAG: hypothetical protein COT74_00410 [Bdellovibrionales bacterium CG10_big_fil_rev_8_21_14_0_10_45_34]|nr:MAG: hypothetical protein COT74_00410 [Bdellovibrionales bacterium CG10_big_fil_rev_8_21_14_0_10_45_34]
MKYQGKCSRCSSKGNLNVDHIKPVHIGGSSNIENLRLLCFHCNQARHINSKTFLESPHRTKKRSSHVATS